MKLISFLIILFPFFLNAQKLPIGLIVKFEKETLFAEKLNIVKDLKGILPLIKEHELVGFDVSLLEGEADMILEDYQNLKGQLEALFVEVEFVSVLYKTNEGAIGGDLPKLYLKPRNQDYISLIKKSSYAFKSVLPHSKIEGVWEVEVDKNTLFTPRQLQQQLTETGGFEFISVNTFHSLKVTSNDPYFENQWGLENEGTAIHFDGTAGADMNVPAAWVSTTGSPDIKIAVLDSGTDTNHVDLVGNLLPGYDATGGGQKGYPNTTFSNDGHGTCVAGIISAIGDNEEGISGVAPDCKIVPIRIFYYIMFGTDIIPFTSSEAGINGMLWALDSAKVDILSNSWGLGNAEIGLLGVDTVMSNMVISNGVLNGRDGKGTPMLFSSGNDGNSFSIWPASIPSTISVGASTMCDELKTPSDCSPEGWWGSNYGVELDVTAPGVKVISTDMTGTLGYNDFEEDEDYSMFNGTSAACPNAAGVMALILSANPDLSSFDARGILSITADKTGGYGYGTASDFGMKSAQMGYGRVNAGAAVDYAITSSSIHENGKEENNVKVFYGDTETFLSIGAETNSLISVYNLIGELVTEIEGKQGLISLNQYVGNTGVYLIHLKSGKNPTVLKAFVNK